MKVFEVYGTGVHNLGAVLMANAASTRLRALQPDAKIVVGAAYGDAEARARLQLGITDDVPGRLAGTYTRLAPASVRRVLGITAASDVTALFDASGFSYADPFGARPAQRLLAKMSRSERRGQKLVLLPQAYGPFEDPGVAAACKALFDRADLMFARDPQSLEAGNALTGAPKAILSPDFTIGLEPAEDRAIAQPDRYAAFVPNFRMLKRKDDPDGATYTALVTDLLRAAQAHGLPVVIVLHSREEDLPLANRIAEAVEGARIVTHHDPLVLKGVLGRAQLVIGSRFHALVSAMSQGVPCLGLGWAHKYEWLFRDFGCGAFLVNVTDPATAKDRLESLIEDASNRAQREVLLRSAQALKAQNESMWARVAELIAKGGADVNAAG